MSLAFPTGLRGLVRRRELLTLGASTLAIGFAGNITVFSILDSLLLRPHPFPGLERLVLVREVRATIPARGATRVDPVRALRWE